MPTLKQDHHCPRCLTCESGFQLHESSVGAILVIARWGGRQQQGEYKIRPYGWHEGAAEREPLERLPSTCLDA
jgi:hypothetical protein